MQNQAIYFSAIDRLQTGCAHYFFVFVFDFVFLGSDKFSHRPWHCLVSSCKHLLARNVCNHKSEWFKEGDKEYSRWNIQKIWEGQGAAKKAKDPPGGTPGGQPKNHPANNGKGTPPHNPTVGRKNTPRDAPKEMLQTTMSVWSSIPALNFPQKNAH